MTRAVGMNPSSPKVSVNPCYLPRPSSTRNEEAGLKGKKSKDLLTEVKVTSGI